MALVIVYLKSEVMLKTRYMWRGVLWKYWAYVARKVGFEMGCCVTSGERLTFPGLSFLICEMKEFESNHI